MVVAGFAKNVDKQRKEEFEQTKDNYGLYRFILSEVGVPQHVSFLTSADSMIDLYVHTFSSQKGIKAPLCNKLYGKECDYCEEVGKFGKQYSKKVRAAVGYVYDAVGRKIKSKKDPKKIFDDNPEKIIEIPAGKAEGNWVHLVNFAPEFRQMKDGGASDEALKDYLTQFRSLIYKFIRRTVIDEKSGDEKAVFDVPTVLHPIELKKLGEQFVFDIPQEVQDKYDSKSVSDHISLILNGYTNVDYPFFNKTFEELNNVDKDGNLIQVKPLSKEDNLKSAETAQEESNLVSEALDLDNL